MAVPDRLRGERVRLTAMTEADLPALASWQEDGEYLRLLSATPAHPRTDLQLRQWLADEQRGESNFIFGVRPLERDDLLGFVTVGEIVWNQRVGWLTIGIGDAAARGQGYGTEAVRLALGFAFGELNLRRMQLTVFAYNERAIALYERLGFRREGVFREFLERDGRTWDMYLYGILRGEWEARA